MCAGVPHTGDAVHGFHRIGGVVLQLLPLCIGRNVGSGAQNQGGDVVLGQQHGQAVGTIVLGHRGSSALRESVGAPVVGRILRLEFTPSDVVAILLGCRGAQVGLGPQGAAGQAQVDIIEFILLELGSVGGVAGYGNGAGVVGVAVAPLPEAVAQSGDSAEGNPGVGAIGAAAGYAALRGIGRDGVDGVLGETCAIIAHGAHRQTIATVATGITTRGSTIL